MKQCKPSRAGLHPSAHLPRVLCVLAVRIAPTIRVNALRKLRLNDASLRDMRRTVSDCRSTGVPSVTGPAAAQRSTSVSAISSDVASWSSSQIPVFASSASGVTTATEDRICGEKSAVSARICSDDDDVTTQRRRSAKPCTLRPMATMRGHITFSTTPTLRVAPPSDCGICFDGNATTSHSRTSCVSVQCSAHLAVCQGSVPVRRTLQGP